MNGERNDRPCRPWRVVSWIAPLLLLGGCAEPVEPLELPRIDWNPRRYFCFRTDERIRIDGRLDEAVWDRAPWTDEFSQRFGEVKAKLEKRGERVDDFDVAIAAYALAYDAVVVTDNVRHFRRIPGVVVETWTA